MFEMDSERGYLGHVLATATVPHLHGNWHVISSPIRYSGPQPAVRCQP